MRSRACCAVPLIVFVVIAVARSVRCLSSEASSAAGASRRCMRRVSARSELAKAPGERGLHPRQERNSGRGAKSSAVQSNQRQIGQ